MTTVPAWPLKFEQVTKISTKFRRLTGACPTITNCNKFWWIKNGFWIIFATICTCLPIYSILYHDFKNKKYADAIQNGIMAIVAMTIGFKHLILLRCRESIKKIIEIMNRDYEVADDFNDEEKKIVIKFAILGTKICKYWVVASVVSSWMFHVRATVIMIYYYCKGDFKFVPVVELHYPFINEYKNIPIVFCILFFIFYCFTMYACFMYIGFDPLVPAIVAHTCGQLELISIRVLKLFSTSKSTEEINESLKQMNIKLMEIYSIVDILQDNFAVFYDFVMKTTTFLLSLSGFQIVAGLKRKEISVEFVPFFLGSILHFYSPCYFSNLLIDKNDMLRQAIYSCGWELQPNIKIRKTILLMLTRTTKSIVIRTVFLPICLDTFAEMARQSYAIYNIMNAAWG